MHFRLRKRSALILGFLAFIICSILLIPLLARQKIQTLTLIDGTKLHFLGITGGTNHWNPTTPFIIRAINRAPALRWVVGYAPKPGGSQPAMAVTPQGGTVLWFNLEKRPVLGQQFVFRCLNKDGEQVTRFENLDFRSETNATPIWLPLVEADEAANIHKIEIYLRNMPLSGANNDIFNPIPGIIYPGFRVGEFEIQP